MSHNIIDKTTNNGIQEKGQAYEMAELTVPNP